MKLLIDMNLSPDWVEVFRRNGWEALHWSMVGDPRATDRAIMEWARANGYVVFTHDLDFGALLAVTQLNGPSVIQVRTQDIMPRPRLHYPRQPTARISPRGFSGSMAAGSSRDGQSEQSLGDVAATI